MKRIRLWSLHPVYLDKKGLIALWREALLAQKVLLGLTKGYRYHPQLNRFKECHNPSGVIAFYLLEVYREAVRRGYAFNEDKIGWVQEDLLPLKRGQLFFEYYWLQKKLRKRSLSSLEGLPPPHLLQPHPLFYLVEGGQEEWEKIKLEEVDNEFS